MVEVWLRYGNSEVPARIPEERLLHMLRPGEAGGIPDADLAIRQMIRGDGTFLSTARGSTKTAVVVGHSQNPSQLEAAVKAVTSELTEAGLTESSITLIRTADSNLNPDQLKQFSIHDHEPAKSPTQAWRECGVPFLVEMNSDFISADLKIVVAELRVHQLLGTTGLSDIAFPELASSRSFTAHISNRKGGQLTDLVKERMKINSSLPNFFALGLILNSELAPVSVSFGGFAKCVEELSPQLAKLRSVNVERPADIVVMSVGGAPFDQTLLRAVEAFPTALPALKKDGAMIVAAECAQGHGDTEFYDWSAEKKEPRYLESRLRLNFNYNGYKAALLSRLLSHRVYLVSTIPDYYVENVFGMRSAATVNAAIQTANRALGSDSTITVIPDASQVRLLAPQLPSA